MSPLRSNFEPGTTRWAMRRAQWTALGLTPEDVAEDELAGYCRGRLAAYKTPVRWLITDAFPLTSTGKSRDRKSVV